MIMVGHVSSHARIFPFLYWILLSNFPFVAAKNATFLWLSDLHLDPLYGTPMAAEGLACRSASAGHLGQIGCDAPYSLVDQSIQFAVNLTSSSQPSFILLTGDLVRHGTDQLENPVETTRSILGNISHLIIKSFPDISILPTIGNNDVTPDYFLDVDDNPGEMLEMLLQGLDPLFASEEERTSFRLGGYLARDLSSTLTILSLNTVIYATSHYPETRDSDPLGQFSWLKTQLSRAQAFSRQVYIVAHIPPAVGSYRHSQLWRDEYLDLYYDLIEEFQSVIVAQCFGHLHADEFRFLHHRGSPANTTRPSWPILLASSVTPVYGSHPSIREVTYDVRTNALLDYDTWFIDLEHPKEFSWQREFSFLESFPMAHDLSADSLSEIVMALNATIHVVDAPIWKALKRRQHVSLEEPTCTDVDCRKAWLCTLASTTVTAYTECLQVNGMAPLDIWKTRLDPRVRSWRFLVGIVALILTCCMCTYCLMCNGPRYFRRRHYQRHLSQEEEGDVVMKSNNFGDEEVLDDDEEVPMELPGLA